MSFYPLQRDIINTWRNTPQFISEDIRIFVLWWLLSLTPPTTKTAASHSLSLDSERLIGLVCNLRMLTMVAVVIAQLAVMVKNLNRLYLTMLMWSHIYHFSFKNLPVCFGLYLVCSCNPSWKNNKVNKPAWNILTLNGLSPPVLTNMCSVSRVYSTDLDIDVDIEISMVYS